MKNQVNGLLAIAGLVLSLAFSSCVVIENQYSALAPGIWRAQLKLEQNLPAGEYEADEVILDIDEVVLPVVFELSYDEKGEILVTWMNGSERIVCDSVLYGRDRKTGKDSIRIEFPEFDTHISAWYEERVIEGYWEVHYKDNYRIPFVAFYGQRERFKSTGKDPVANLTGKWACTFETGSPGQYPAFGEFVQEGNKITGTFLTETGDYRFLEGLVEEDKFSLSCFDGAHAFLFEGKIVSRDSVIGSFRSGKHYTTVWEGRRTEQSNLRDPHEMNKVLSSGPVEIRGLDTEGKMRSSFEEKFQGKIKVVQIMGTWCPNCFDETHFLKEYIQSNTNSLNDVAFLALSFEAYSDQNRNLGAIERYAQRMGLPYPIWLGGNKNKSEASKQLPFLDTLISFPTLLIMDRNDRIRKVHTGFSGPATSEYNDFKINFEEYMASLLNEVE